MANLVKVDLIKVDSRTFNETVLLNTNLIDDLYTENSVTKINYQWKGLIKRLEVSNTLSDLNDAIGSYTSNMRISSVLFETIDNQYSNTTHSLAIDDVLWVDKFTASSVRVITERKEIVITKTSSQLLDDANKLTEQIKNIIEDDHFEMVKVATTSSLTLSNLKTVDTISLSAGDRVLVWKQSDAKLNGIYEAVSGGDWTRTSDSDGSAPEGELKSNRTVFVSHGSVHIGKTFAVDNEEIPVVGTDVITFKAIDSVTAIGVGTISQDKFNSAFLTKVAKVDHLSVSQAVDLDAIETNSNASKVKTDLITVTQAVDLDAIETNSNASKVKADFISVTQAVDLDAIETNSNASKVKADFISVTQAVDLDAIETNSNASKVKTDFIAVTQAVDLDAIETNSNASKVKTDHLTVTGAVSLDAIKTKADLITVTQAVDLDAIETNSNASKVKADLITVTQAVDLDAIETNSNASKVKADLITVTQAVDLDAIETNSNASKVKADLITVTQAVDLDAIETNSNASKVKADLITVTQAVDLDAIETNSNASKVKADLITVTQAVDLDAIETNSNASKVKTDHLTVTGAVSLDAIKSKVDGIEASATADQSNAEIKTAYEANFSVAMSSATSVNKSSGSISFTVTANEPAVFAITDTNSSGLVINALTGVISGTQNTGATYNFVIHILGIKGGRATGALAIVVS